MAKNNESKKTGNKGKKVQFSKITQNIKSMKKKKNAEKIEQPARPKKKRGVMNKVLIAFMIVMILGALSVLSFAVYIIIKSPDFDVEKLYSSASTTIYDINNNVIAELGVEKRENVTYDELPEIVVDALIATEDSKFFQHAGIDILRFGKAVVGQLLGQGGAGGGSTLTMQVAKNSYSRDENGQIADSGIPGIIRKFTDIYMAVFKIEKTYSKQEIIEFYVNQANFGSGAYGIQQAAQTYFKKDVGELNLAEAALLVGLFQAPGAYNPYVAPETAQSRRNQVLNLMVRHGYITQEEAAVARSIDVSSMLSGYNYSYSQYQGFIDALAADVEKETGKNPYDYSMKVYSTLDPERQKVINDFYEGKTGFKWKNDVIECAVAITDVNTGAIVALGRGKNKTGERQWNLATSIRRHPGSTIKPILDYGPAIEYEGWGTGSFVMDDVYSYSNGQTIMNVSNDYYGIMTAKRALAQSRNIPALQVFQATSQADKYEFATNLGIDIPLNSDKQIFESASIGAFDGVSPLQLSAAYGAFARGGIYIEPYTFNKVEFNNTGETYNHTPKRTKAMSEETAYIINYILRYAVASGNVKIGSGVAGTDVASKTGTTSLDATTIKNKGLSKNAIRDIWQVVYSPDYALAFWYGYDEPTKQYHMTSYEGWNARTSIASVLTPRIMKKNSRFNRPSGVTEVVIELETNPVQLASEATPANLRSTEIFKKGTEPTEVSYRFRQLEDVSNLTYSTVGNQINLSWSAIDTPDAIDDDFLQDYFIEGYSRWADKYYQRRLEYNQNNIGTVVYEIFVKQADGTLYSLGTTSSTSFSTPLTNATSVTLVVKSRYSIFRDNASNGREINVSISPSILPPVTGGDEESDNPNDSSGSTSDNETE